MASYKVMTDSCTLAPKGSTVDTEQLDGYNVDALISAGHIAEVTAKTKTDDPAKDK